MDSEAIREHIQAVVETNDASRVVAAVQLVEDWSTVDAETVNWVFETIGMYGASGRTDRYEDALTELRKRHAASDLWRSILLMDNRGAHALLEAAGNLDRVNENGWTPLHAAAERGNLEMATTLCERGADTNIRDNHGQTPLDYASHAGPWKSEPATEVLEIIEKTGRRLNFWEQARVGGMSELQRLIAEGQDVNETDRSGCTALFHAAKNNHTETVTWLLAQGADPNLACTDGQTPLSTAVLHTLSQECDIQIIKALLAHGGVMTLFAAIVLNDEAAVLRLIDSNPDALKGQSHDTALGYAIHTWKPDMLECLLKLGARPNEENWGHIRRIINQIDADPALYDELESLT
jgi:ankyrin repeat protein